MTGVEAALTYTLQPKEKDQELKLVARLLKWRG
jgi:hypothetical protein